MKYICLYAKPPVAGETKSRLAKKIGGVAAAELAGAMIKDVCAAVLEVSEAIPQLWIPPDCTQELFHGYAPSEFTVHRQRGNDLGERMSNTFFDLFADIEEEAQVVIIGSDCITHDHKSLVRAFAALDASEVVLQPASDGGYVLIGQSHWRPEIFEGIDWGSSDVFQQSIGNGIRAEITYELLPESFDVDTIHDVHVLKEFVRDHSRTHVLEWFKANNDLVTGNSGEVVKNGTAHSL